MWVATCRRHDVFDGVAANGQRIGDKRAMAAPRDGFSAHDGASFRLGEVFETRERGGEFRRLHVVGVAAETGILPAGVYGMRARMAQAAEFWQMRVCDSDAAKRCGKGVAIELRIVARARNGANVHEALDAVGFEECDKVRKRAVGMADGEQERAGANSAHRRHASRPRERRLSRRK